MQGQARQGEWHPSSRALLESLLLSCSVFEEEGDRASVGRSRCPSRQTPCRPASSGTTNLKRLRAVLLIQVLANNYMGQHNLANVQSPV